MAVRTHQIPVLHPRRGRPGSSRWFALAVLCVSILMVNLDVPIAAVGLLCAIPLVPDSKNPAARRPDLAGAVLSMAGLLLIAAGLWQVSHSSVTWTYTDTLPGLIMTGIGAALVMPAVSGSVMASLPAPRSSAARTSASSPPPPSSWPAA